MEDSPQNKKGSVVIPLLVVGLLILAFVSGSLWQKVKTLEQGSVAGAGTGATGAPKASPLSIDNLKAYASQLKLDTKKFNTCLDNSEKKAEVDKQQTEGSSEGVSGTPGFFVNGHLIAGALPFETFKTVIDYELSKGLDNINKTSPPAEIKGLVDKQYLTEDFYTKKTVATAGYPTTGNPNAKITLVEYSDFECPYCIRANATVKQILSAYPNDVKLVYKQYPLVQIHQNAQKAAEASLCANDQGKFWEYHDKLFGSEGQ